MSANGFPLTTRPPADQGFTLVEVLVALVVTALILSIVMNGAVSAAKRSRITVTMAEAELVALEQLETVLGAEGQSRSLKGKSGNITWAVTQQQIAGDPRGIFTLVRYDVTAGPPNKPALIRLSRRKFLPADEANAL